MKIVFNFNSRLRGASPLAALLRGAACAFAVALTLCAAPAARADGVYWSTRDLLADFFRSSARVTYQRVVLQGAFKARVEARLGYALARDTYNVFVATTDGHVDGYAIIDDENGQHLPITFAVKISPTGAVERQEIVAYREARGDEVRDERFRRQFQGKTTRDAIRPGEDVQVVSGATISSRAMAIGVKRALVLVEETMLRPQQISAASAPTARR